MAVCERAKANAFFALGVQNNSSRLTNFIPTSSSVHSDTNSYFFKITNTTTTTTTTKNYTSFKS